MDSPRFAELGRLIAEARRVAGLTQRDLATRMGVSLYTLDRYERGEDDPSDNLAAAAVATSFPEAWFRDGPAGLRDEARRLEEAARSQAERAAEVERRTQELDEREARLARFQSELTETKARIERASDSSGNEQTPPTPPLDGPRPASSAAAPRQTDTRLRRWLALLGVAVLLAAAGWLLFVFALDRGSSHDTTLPASLPAAPTAPARRQQASPAATTAPRRQQASPVPVQLTVTATRGACYLMARVGDANGRALYQGVLAIGQTLDLRGKRIWMRLGAAGNISVRLNGRTLTGVPAGTVDVVATPSGVRPTG